VTPAELVALKAELANDPLALGYAAHLPGDPQRVVDLLTAPAYTSLQPITAARALTWAGTGPMSAITDAANNSASPARASCLSFLHSLSSSMPLDPSDPDVKSMFDGWQTLGVITVDQHAALLTAATKPASRADVLGIPAPTARDIIDALG
jgi:hypothetical protein